MREQRLKYSALRALLCVLMAVLWLAPAAVARADEEYVPGEVVVVVEEPVANITTVETEIQKEGYAVEERLAQNAGDAVIVAEVPQDTSVEQAVSDLEAVEGVVLAQPNYVYHLVEPSNVVGSEQTDLNDTYQKRGLLQQLSLASVLNAWDMVRTNRSVSVAVIDTGCRMSHEDLVNNVDWAHAWDFINGDGESGQSLATSLAANPSDAGDGNGHGTHVCGVVAGEANNSKGVAGSSFNATLIPMRALDEDGSGSTTTITNALAKVLSFKRAGVNVRVVNLSLGGAGTDRALERMISTLADEGVLCVCAAGNESSSDAFTPADAPAALSVMALDKNLEHTYYTNYKQGSNINTTKTVSAMGGGATTNPDWVWSSYKTSDSSYAGMAGTSQATPVVSGIAALLFTANPNLSPYEVRQILASTTDPVNAAGVYSYKDASSAGSVNAYKAVMAAKQTAASSVAKPAGHDLTYAGVEQAGVLESVAYELKTVELSADQQPYELADIPVADAREGARGTKVGTYQTFVHLKAGYQWDDGTTADQSVVWRIAPAQLVARYASVTVLAGDVVPTDVVVSGFVNGEQASSAAGYNAPVLYLGSAVDAHGRASLPAGEKSHEYAVELRDGAADNYEFSYEIGTVTVRRKIPVDVPEARACVYTGKAQMGVPDSELYTIGGETEKNAGTYSVTLRLRDSARYEWSDGTTEPKVVQWSIQRAPLTVRYDGGKTLVGTKVADVPASMTVEGFVNGESAATLSSFELPELAYVVGSTQSALSAQGNASVHKLDSGVTSSVGVKYLVPAVGAGGFDQGNPTANYEFSVGKSGELAVYGKATVPTASNKTYNGQAQRGVTSGSHCVLKGTAAATAAGTYAATASLEKYYIWADKGLGDAIADRKFTWKIAPASIAAASVAALSGGAYTGAAKTPAPTVKANGVTLQKDTDYTLAYRNNVNVGTATVTITGKGNYTGTKSATFRITAASVTSVSVATQTFNGSALKPRPTVKAGSTVVPLSGYGVSYKNSVNAGTATVTVTGKGNFAGTKSATFRIVARSLASASVGAIAKQAYTGTAIKPQAKVVLAGKTLKAEVDYTLKYANNVKAGKATVTIAGKGNYSDTKKTTFSIVLPSVSYRVHVQSIGNQAWMSNGAVAGTVGKAKRLEGIWLKLGAGFPVSGGIQYRTHVQTYGWQSWRANGAMSGTSGKAKRLEAIQIKLTGAMAARYDVYYRVHAQRFGWMGWAKNGAQAGTAGYAYRLEGIQVMLVPKNAAAPGSTARAFIKK